MKERRKPAAGEFYRHFKGNLYQVHGIARHSETGEEMVVYQALYGSYGWYVRPLEMFLEPVDREKYPDAVQAFRFEKIQPEDRELPQEKSADTAVIKQETEGDEGTSGEAASVPDSTAEDQVSPVLLQFLDAETPRDKIEILNQFGVPAEDDREKLRILYGMAASVDLESGDKTARELYEGLKNYLVIRGKYEKPRRL